MIFLDCTRVIRLYVRGGGEGEVGGVGGLLPYVSCIARCSVKG